MRTSTLSRCDLVKLVRKAYTTLMHAQNQGLPRSLLIRQDVLPSQLDRQSVATRIGPLQYPNGIPPGPAHVALGNLTLAG